MSNNFNTKLQKIIVITKQVWSFLYKLGANFWGWTLIIFGLGTFTIHFLGGLFIVIAGILTLPFIFNKIKTFIQNKYKFNFTKPMSITMIVIALIAGFNITTNSKEYADNRLQVANKSAQKLEESKQSETSKSNQDIEQKALEEKKKREDLENKIKIENQEKEKLISQAILVNQDITFDETITDNQSTDEVKKANTQIAQLGVNTKDKKLFNVLSVTDGDTIKISELGTLRLIGIDTPETKDPRKPVQCFGKEATEYAKNQLINKKVYLEFDPANRIDKYNRTLAYVYRDDGFDYNLEVVKNGFAFAYTKYSNPKMETFVNAQKEAREAKKGLWSENTCNGESKAISSSTTVKNEPIAVPVVTPTPASVVTPPPVINITPAPTPAPEPVKPIETNNGEVFIAGSCTELRKRGIGNFPKGSVNYTANRDRNNDGIACELQ